MTDPTEFNDIETILAVTNTDVDEVIHAVTDNADCLYTWDYTKGARPALEKLYEKAKGAQWNGQTDLPWDTETDPYRMAAQDYDNAPEPLGETVELRGTGLETWSRDEWVQYNVEAADWALSQFMHGEQGALVCTAKIVETVPWIDAKHYARHPGNG